MKDRVGETFEGSISSVVPFGIFVALDGVFVEGLVHVSDLGHDYFHFEEKSHAMVGERTGKRFRLSDRVCVQLTRVDMEANKIDFRLADVDPGGGLGDRWRGVWGLCVVHGGLKGDRDVLRNF